MGMERVIVFPYSKMSMRQREGIRKLQNHNYANTTLIIITDKIHKWMLKLVDRSSRRNMICIISRNLPQVICELQGKE